MVKQNWTFRENWNFTNCLRKYFGSISILLTRDKTWPSFSFTVIAKIPLNDSVVQFTFIAEIPAHYFSHYDPLAQLTVIAELPLYYAIAQFTFIAEIPAHYFFHYDPLACS